MGRRIYLDIEADGLLDTISRIWCIVAKDIDSGEIFLFHPKISTACHTCSGSGNETTRDGVYLCTTCDGDGSYILGDHNEWEGDFLKFLSECSEIIGHNVIGYDKPAIEKVLNTKITPTITWTDTLVMSRLFRPVTPPGGSIEGCSVSNPKSKRYVDNRIGGHSLAAWGKRLGFPKQDFDDWSKFSMKMLAYCINDVDVGIRIWEYLEQERLGFKDPRFVRGEVSEPVPFGELSLRLEQSVASCLREQERNGFYLDRTATKKLRDETETLLTDMNKDLHTHFPPVKKYVKDWKPKLTKSGKLTKASERILDSWVCVPATSGCLVPTILHNGKEVHEQYALYEMQEFNPNSGQQVAARLLVRGWEPKVFTPKGAPSTAKEPLREAVISLKGKYPEIAFLENYSIVFYNNQKAKKWLEIAHADSRVYGKINPMGAGTHRCTHSDDNMANIARVQHDSTTGEVLKGVEGSFGWDCRNCWSVPDGKVLVGADASGIQLRALAHYMGDTNYTAKLINADIHVVNQHAAGIKDRPTAKTFIYAWLLGAGDEKIGTIVGVEPHEIEDLIKYGNTEQKFGRPLTPYIINSLKQKKRKATKEAVATIIKGCKTKKQFLDRTPALKRLRTKDIPKATKEGYLVGLDGRKLWIPSEHLAMSMYLQGFEAVIMKAAICCYQQELNKRGIPFKQVVFVHDEVQVECLPEHADIVGQSIVNGIKRAGNIFKSRCPLDGEYKVGKTWAETH